MKVRANALRKKKRVEPSQRQERRPRDAIEGYLKKWKLWTCFRHGYAASDREAMFKALLKIKAFAPKVALTPAALATGHGGAIRGEIDQALAGVASSSFPSGTPEEWDSWYPATLVGVEELVGGGSGPAWTVPKEGGPLAEIVRQRLALNGLLNDLQHRIPLQTLARRSRITTGLFSLQPGPLLKRTVGVDFTPAQVRYFEVDGGRRRAYLSGTVLVLRPGASGSVWDDWPASVIPGAGAGPDYPVSVRGHALKQLGERLVLPEAGTAIHLNLSASLRYPVLSPGRTPDDYLVEYRMNGRLLGHLVARRLGHDILVRAFLLVTMRGTPRGNSPSRQLGLNRPGIEYTGLGRWSTFARTDIREGPRPVNLFASCGCGGLFDPAADLLQVRPDRKPPPGDLAVEWLDMADRIARRYLRQLRAEWPDLSWHPSHLEDLAAEARLKLVEVVTELAGEMAGDDLRRYAARSIWNHLRDRRKASSRYDRRFRGECVWDSLPTRRRPLASDRLPELIALLPEAFEALRRFSPRLFEAAHLGLRQEWPGVEVARILNISPRTAQRRLEEAREWLKEWLERNGLDCCQKSRHNLQNSCRSHRPLSFSGRVWN